ncbi:CLUMA_CG005618, isoform A [Clunio marinus]|uniref:CLUMA_CG005618, isoform A n=1 Tax=Clunio marinus TaxID=568069 RepID=A0A1J1HZS5_9DIPT|nr:CLUMA_CG005618, isoform A [Clunio marinus]
MQNMQSGINKSENDSKFSNAHHIHTQTEDLFKDIIKVFGKKGKKDKRYTLKAYTVKLQKF